MDGKYADDLLIMELLNVEKNKVYFVRPYTFTKSSVKVCVDRFACGNASGNGQMFISFKVLKIMFCLLQTH